MNLTPQSAIRIILGGFLLVAAALSVVIPLGEAADEVSHYSYVRYMAEFGAPPPAVVGTTVFGETFQPPLYYALAAPLTAWLPTGDESNLGVDIPVENNPDWEPDNRARTRRLLQPAMARWQWQGEALGWHIARLLSVLLGVGTVYFTYRLGQVVWHDERWTPLLGALFVACLPSFAGVSAAVTNDALATLIGAILLWRLAYLITSPAGFDWRQWALIGLFGAIGAWSKASGWLFAPTTVIAIALWCLNGVKVKRKLGCLFVAGTSWLVGVLPLWWLNLHRSGDLMGRTLQTMVTDARTQLTVNDGVDLLYSLLRTWWAGFGGAVHLSFTPLITLGLGLIIFGVTAWGLTRRHLRRAEASEATRTLIPFLALHVVIVFGAWGVWTMQVLGTGQGRLLFPALPALAVLIAGGWAAIPRVEDARAPTPGGTFAALMVVVLLQAITSVVLPAYRIEHIPELPPESATVGRWQVGSTPLALTSFYAPFTVDSRLQPGESVSLYLGWQSIGTLPDLRARLRWIDRDGNLVGAPKEGSPIANHPLTDEWSLGTYAATHRIIVPEGIPPGYYRLMLSVIDKASGEPLPLNGADGNTGNEIMVGQTTVIAP